MKFLSFSLVALSSLFAASYAAPTASPADVVPAPDVSVPKPLDVADTLDRRTDSVVCSKMKTTIVEVKKHTSKINSTMEGVTYSVSEADKTGIIKLVKSEVTIVIQLVATLVGEVVELLGSTVEAVEKEELVALVLELVFEILYTLKHVIETLKISKSMNAS